MRILHIAPTPFFSDRGCHIRIRGIVSGLDGLETTNRLCTYPIGRDDDAIDTVRCLPVPGYRKTAAGPSAFKVIVDPLLVLTVVRQIRTFKPDVLHCHLHEGVLIGWLAKYLALRPRLPLGFDVQGGLVSELQSYGHLKHSLLRRSLRWIESFVIARAKVYFCSSEASVRLFADEFGVRPDRLNHVPDGSDIVIDDDDRRTPDGGVPVAVYAGGLTESKGSKMLQEIMRKAAERQLPLRFRIIGYPVDDMQSFVEKHGLTNCELVGRVPFESLAEHLANASIALEPKSGETSEASGKLLNYMAAKLPVVCFDTSNNRSMLDSAGYYAKDGSVDSFVDQLEAVLSDPGTAQSRAEAGHDRVQSTFSWRSSASTILSNYRRLLPTPDPS